MNTDISEMMKETMTESDLPYSVSEKNEKTAVSLIDKLFENHSLSKPELVFLLENRTKKTAEYLFEKSRLLRHKFYGNGVYIRGLIEYSSYCKNNCLYCGIRCSNKNAQRYRLSEEEILSCCEEGYRLGFRTFVIQGGEDPFVTDEQIEETVMKIKKNFPDCAVTLSLGEKERESYERFFKAGADRYLLRHETADENHYSLLHPKEMSFSHRMKCLSDLKDIGYQVGCGIMVGSPFQTNECIAEDLIFMEKFKPHMVGIGPFIPQHDTPFRDKKQGSLSLTLYLLGLIRLLLPNVLLPSTTALGTIHPYGREMGILAGANVVMPNLSPVGVRKKYQLYDNKICTGDEAAQCIGCMSNRMESVGYKVLVDRGDFKEI